MPHFLDLPLDLLPSVLSHLVKPHHLALCCLVNKTFLSFAVPQLYERIHIYAWHKQGKIKVIRLFWTLAERPELARWVRKLELRDFPKAYDSESYNKLMKTFLFGLANCISLHSCTWTRDQTLSTEILNVLSLRCPGLRELEINGHATGNYDPKSLLMFCSLSKISIIMPSAELVDILPGWLEKTGETLMAFHVLCKSSGLITDLTLENLAPFMKRLKHFHIAGCPRVTPKGIRAVLAQNAYGLESLGLEGLSATFDLDALNRFAPPLVSLTSLTLTLPPSSVNHSWSSGFLALTNSCPLSEIHLYMSGGHTMSDAHALLTPDLIESFLARHALRLHKFSIHRLMLLPEMVGSICASCPNLESLFVVIDDYSVDALVPELARSRSLRNVHVNFSHKGDSSIRLCPNEVLAIARRIGSGIQQLGFANRVYQINRVANAIPNGEVMIDMELASYEYPGVPEQFLVVRT